MPPSRSRHVEYHFQVNNNMVCNPATTTLFSREADFVWTVQTGQLSTMAKNEYRFFIAKVDKRLLEDDNGKVDTFPDDLHLTSKGWHVNYLPGMTCCSKHLPPDQAMFDPWDVIYGPLDAIPHRSNKFDVPHYEKVKEAFVYVKKHGQEGVI